MDYSVRFKLNERQDELDVDVYKIDKDDLKNLRVIKTKVVLENTDTLADIFKAVEDSINDSFIEFDAK